MFCEQFANKIAFREHQYNLSAIIDSLILFANPIIFVRKPFFGILFSNISNTSKLSDEILNYPFITTQRPPLSGSSWRIKPLVCRTLRSRRIVLTSTLKCVASEADVSRTFLGHSFVQFLSADWISFSAFQWVEVPTLLVTLLVTKLVTKLVTELMTFSFANNITYWKHRFDTRK